MGNQFIFITLFVSYYQGEFVFVVESLNIKESVNKEMKTIRHSTITATGNFWCYLFLFLFFISIQCTIFSKLV